MGATGGAARLVDVAVVRFSPSIASQCLSLTPRCPPLSSRSCSVRCALSVSIIGFALLGLCLMVCLVAVCLVWFGLFSFGCFGLGPVAAGFFGWPWSRRSGFPLAVLLHWPSYSV